MRMVLIEVLAPKLVPFHYWVEEYFDTTLDL